MTEDLLIELFKEQYGDILPVRLNGGYTNETFLLKGTSPLLVAKVALSNIENEVNSLKLLHDSGISPTLYEHKEISNLQVTLSEFCEGQNGQSIVDHNDPDRTRVLYKRMAAILAKSIHSRKYANDSYGIRTSNMNELNYHLAFVPEVLAKQSIEILKRVNDLPAEWVLTHGDYGMHNVLLSEADHLTVLDWEWAEWGNPLSDVSWVCWFTLLHYPQYAKSLNPLFIEEYQHYSQTNFSSDELKACCLYQVWKVLNKLDHSPVEVQQEWVRRLEWTLQTDIFHFVC
ncbi:aminoglycoside phosphotransferase family protein [Bacillus sp. JJ1122]|uniref:phosphotransferase family protein n=1 Tax=Bacillus sp. JJ1122 TaxID=3122951 RepID=UPI002FFF0712